LLSKNYSFKATFAKSFRSVVADIINRNYTTTAVERSLSRAELTDTLEDRLQFLTFSPIKYEDRLSQLLCDSNIPQLLRYEDRNSMRFSVESRVPFLETDLVEFIMSLPAGYKIRNGYTKSILRDALAGLVPDEVRMRINKLGFPTPELEWLKQGFNIDVNITGSRPWRDLVTTRWQHLIQQR
jgi:asparagine synthase (glutamine-hydrolysing)